MIRRPPRSTLDRSSAASDVYKRQLVSSFLQKKQPADIARLAAGKDDAGPYIGLKRNFAFARFAFAFALRRDFCVGVSKARSRRTSSMIPSASSLLFKRLRARSIGSPLRTMTSGM